MPALGPFSVYRQQSPSMPIRAATCQPQFDLLPDGHPDADVRAQVWGLVSTLYPKNDLTERRRETRYPFPYLVHLSPVGENGETPCGESVVVVGKHISHRGLGFYHPAPLPYRRVIASLESGGHWYAFLLDLNWCRFTRQGWYESGGRFLQVVAPPVG